MMTVHITAPPALVSLKIPNCIFNAKQFKIPIFLQQLRPFKTQKIINLKQNNLKSKLAI